MSHFFVGVIIPKGREHRYEKEVDRMLAPYSEDVEVKAYMRECYCVGAKAFNECRDAVDVSHGNIDSVRKEFWERHKGISDEEADRLWESEVRAPRRAAIDALLAQRTDRRSPDQNCASCNGAGEYESTRNPLGYWDWFQIGGRWDGNVPDNHCIVSQLPSGLKFFALVTPDGMWHQRGQMGWFACVSNEKPQHEWDDKIKSILASHHDHMIVGVDCHV
jgi:hypothetical protein